MKNYELSGPSGFQVIHNSHEWRIALHNYDKNVNGMEAVKEWGIHIDSEEAFVLLQGNAVLAVLNADGQLQIQDMVPSCLYVVAAGERHVIILKEHSQVLIMENYDMDRFESVHMDLESYLSIKAVLEQSG